MKSPIETTTTPRPRHVRRNAVVWNDLISLVHPEKKAESAVTFVGAPSVECHDPHHDDQSTISSMKAEAASLDAQSVVYHKTPNDDQSTIASSIDQTCITPPKSPIHFLDSRPPSEVYIMSPDSPGDDTAPLWVTSPKSPSHLSGNGLPSEVYITSPPPIKRKVLSFDSIVDDEYVLNDGDTHSSPRCISEIQFTESPPMKSPPRLPWLAFQSDDFDDEASLEGVNYI